MVARSCKLPLRKDVMTFVRSLTLEHTICATGLYACSVLLRALSAQSTTFAGCCIVVLYKRLYCAGVCLVLFCVVFGMVFSLHIHRHAGRSPHTKEG